MVDRNDVRIHEFKRIDMKGATIIDGFPSVGLVSSIAANYLIKVLDMEHVGIMDSVHFPTVSLIRDAKPLSPVRIYAGRKEKSGDQIVAFISEFQAPPNLIKPISYTLMDWAEEQRCKMIVSPEGLVVDPELRDSAEISDVVFGIASTQRGRELLKEHGIQSFEEGVISGVAGVLLNEGRKRDFDVLTLLAEAHPDFPDAKAAALVLEAIDDILLGIDFDAKPLFEEAKRIEEHIKEIQKQAVTKREDRGAPRPIMYG
ncbi:MAG: proteasome assembly chaperone family protein [Thermoplasmata archaeon]